MTTKKRVIAIVEAGEDYTDRLITIKADHCTMEEAQQIAREAGYQVIDELCAIVDTTDEIHIIVAVEPEGEEVKKLTLPKPGPMPGPPEMASRC